MQPSRARQDIASHRSADAASPHVKRLETRQAAPRSGSSYLLRMAGGLTPGSWGPRPLRTCAARRSLRGGQRRRGRSWGMRTISSSRSPAWLLTVLRMCTRAPTSIVVATSSTALAHRPTGSLALVRLLYSLHMPCPAVLLLLPTSVSPVCACTVPVKIPTAAWRRHHRCQSFLPTSRTRVRTCLASTYLRGFVRAEAFAGLCTC